ncbi:MAG: T9SS type A sorting domain-containing protein, partial [Bacteroidales bacterium]|nr:T9SS type A sorting domain-containing protein [Bacteroidales bacterium]
FIPAPNFGIAIDDNNNVHVAFGLLQALRNAENQPGEYTQFRGPFLMLMLYWNESMPMIGSTVAAVNAAIKNDVYPLFSMPDITGSDNWWPLSQIDPKNSDYSTYGYHVFQSKIIVENGTVYLFYTSAIPWPFHDILTESYWHGIFATKSIDGGTTWNPTDISWLSYDADLFQIDWTNYENAVSAGAEPTEAIDASTLNLSENAFPSVCASGDKFHLTWFADPTPGLEESFPTYNEYKLYYMHVDKDQIGIFNNIRDITTGIWNNYGIPTNSLSSLNVYPNPASDKLNIVIDSKEAGRAIVSMTNLLGQTVYSKTSNFVNGTNVVNIDVSNMTPGFYVVNVNTNSGKISQKVIVK